MKLFSILVLIVIFAPLSVFSQSDNHNYIIQQLMLDEDGHRLVTTEYYDGLGRKEQMITNGIKPGSTTHSMLTRITWKVWKKIAGIQ